jgi:hypothetical protein
VIVFTCIVAVPSRPKSVTIDRCLQRSVELRVEPPEFDGGAMVTGFQVQNDVIVHQFSLGE